MCRLKTTEVCEDTIWQSLKGTLELLEYTILRKLKKKVWECDYFQGNQYTNKTKQAKASRLVGLFEQSIKERKRAWTAYTEEHGQEALEGLVLPRLEEFADFLETKIRGRSGEQETQG